MRLGNYEDAVLRLEAALCWNSQHQLSRIYLGLSLSLRKNGPGDRLKECVHYLLESMEVLLTDLSKKAATPEESMKKQNLYAENLIRPTNVHLLRGIIQLGKLLAAHSDVKDAMSPIDIFHTAALLASQSLPDVYKADVYKQLEWVLLDAHAILLEMLSAAGKDEELIAQRCERLSALIHNATIPQNQQLLDLQERTSQNLVQIQPCNAHALFLLGSSQLNKFDNSSGDDEAKKLLEDAKGSFQASIELQGKPAEGEVPELVSGQAWYQQRLQAEEEKRKAAALKNAPAPAAGAKPGAAPGRGGAAAGRGTTPAPAGAARGRGTQTPATAGRGAPAAAPGRGAPAPAKRGAATPAVPGRGGAAGAKPGTKSPPATDSASGKAAVAGKAAAGNKAGHKCEATPPPASSQKAKSEPAPTAEATTSEAPKPKKAVPVNAKTYYPYLGLARVYRALEDHKQAQKYYDEVTNISPEVHDAYIESADMLVKADPLSAVDVYCKFPVSENPTFDDAYIFGEIIRILMKHEKYEDPRLASNMISYGRILGLGALERYVKILEEKYKNKLLQTVYAGVNGKSVDDPDMQTFFKFKCWM
nr:hypothetical protein BaRGS_026363 [Batillaria attramentaria]